MFDFFNLNKKNTIEEQIDTLHSLGICFNERFTVNDIINNFYRREEFEGDPYRLLLVAMGSGIYVNDIKWELLSDNIWHLDTECICNPGDYVHIVERMRDLSAGELRIEKIIDDVDLENNIAWVAFTLEGKNYQWDLEVDDDWIDIKILSNFVALLNERKSKKRFTYLDLKGQDCLIGCCDDKQYLKLKKLTGLNFEWLE